MVLPYLDTVIAFILVVNVLTLVLDVRQLKAIKLASPPPQLAHLFSKDKYLACQSYSVDKWWLGMASGFAGLVRTVITLWFGFLPYLWDLTAQLLPFVKGNEIMHTIAFVMLNASVDLAFSLPWSVISTFVVEARHGFNRQTPALFIVDAVKGILLGLVLLPPIVGGFTYILQRSGPLMPVYLWAFVLAVSLVMMAVYPSLIAPLFNKYDPLPDGTLRAGIEALASSLAFPLRKLYTVDGSKRSSHSNAYLYGFGSNKRIVLFDTLLKQCNEEQVVAVLAHELGHWKLRHTPINFAMGQVIVAVQFLLFGALRSAPGLYESFGFVGDKPAFVAFLLFQYLVAPVDEVVHFLTNLVSRTFEFQADRFAVRLGKGEDLRKALIIMQEENKSSMNVDPLYSAYHYSHPPLVERLTAIEAAMRKTL